MSRPQPGYKANGNIAPMKFVKLDVTQTGANGWLVLQSGSGDDSVGISQSGTRNMAGDLGLDDGYAAIAGENIGVYGLGDTCKLELGGSVAPDDLLGSDTHGCGVKLTLVASGAGFKYINARALHAGASGDIIEVVVERMIGLG